MGRPKVIRIKQCATCGKDFDAGSKKGKLNCGKECYEAYQLNHKEERMSKCFDAIKQKYGVSSFFETDGFYEDSKRKKLELYGDENYNNYEKIKNTLKENHGVEHPSQTEGYVEKTKIKKKQKYGDENFNNRDKAKETNLDKLGVEHHHKTEESIMKMKRTNRQRHGVDFTVQSEKSKKNLIRSNKEKFGSEYFFNSKEYLDRVRQAKIEKVREAVSKNNLSFDFKTYDKLRIKTPKGKLHYVKYCISCNNCGKEFDWSLDSIPVCRNCYPMTSVSRQQEELKGFLKENSIEFKESSRSIIAPLELDFYLPEHRIAIQINGNYFHSESAGGKSKDYHLKKSVMCLEKNIRLVHVFEDEWMFKRDIVKSRILNMTSCTSKKVHARKCTVRAIEPGQKNSFLERNHIQGQDVCSVSYGLFSQIEKSAPMELVSVITFSKPRLALGMNSKKEKNVDRMELSRFCSEIGFNVTGAFEKLLKHFIKENPEIKTVYSYADCRWSGLDPKKTVYSKCGFEYLHTSKPNYFYLNTSNYMNRMHRFTYNKKKLLFEFKGDSKKTEWNLAQEAGLDRIWDCGSMKFELKVR